MIWALTDPDAHTPLPPHNRTWGGSAGRCGPAGFRIETPPSSTFSIRPSSSSIAVASATVRFRKSGTGYLRAPERNAHGGDGEQQVRHHETGGDREKYCRRSRPLFLGAIRGRGNGERGPSPSPLTLYLHAHHGAIDRSRQCTSGVVRMAPPRPTPPEGHEIGPVCPRVNRRNETHHSLRNSATHGVIFFRLAGKVE